MNTQQKIESFIENCCLSEIADVANPNCDVCCGMGYYLDDPSPPGIYMSSGHYTHICDCLDEELILDRF